jgi:opacity protein-like surface antigen
MSRLIAFATTAAFVACLFFAISAQADEIEPEPEPAPIAEPAPKADPEPKLEPKPEPVPEPASSQDYSRNGIYVGAGILGASYTEIEDNLEEALGYTVDIDMDPAFGFELYGGYRAHPNFAIEAEFEMVPEADIELSGFGKFAQVESWALTGNLKGFVLTGRIQPFVLVGIGVLHAKIEDTVGLGVSESESEFAARFGGGLDFYFTENIVGSAGVTYLLGTGDLDEIDYVSFGGGIQYRF